MKFPRVFSIKKGEQTGETEKLLLFVFLMGVLIRNFFSSFSRNV